MAAKTTSMQFRCTTDERKACVDAAEIAGLSLTSWALQQLRKGATQELQAAGRPIPFMKRRRNPS